MTGTELQQALMQFMQPLQAVGFGVQGIGHGMIQIAEAIKYAADKQVEVAQIRADSDYVNESRRLSS